MRVKANAHTHTLFCDGQSSAEDMVQAAIQSGFEALGFSGHSYYEGCIEYCMSPQGTLDYIAEIRRLQIQYQDQIRLYLGLELDYYSQVDLSPYDYLIGSVHHYLDPDTGAFYTFDGSVSSFQQTLEKGFQGDVNRLVKTYYTLVTELITQRRPSIIGHFNLIMKRNRDHHLIDETTPFYRQIANEALLACAETGAITEVNTGAISRGYADAPYPNLDMLRLLRDHGYPVMINSDCHSASDVSASFDLAVSLVREAGFHSVITLGRDSLFQEVGLDDIHTAL